MVIGAVGLYMFLLATDPSTAKASFISGIKEVEELIVPFTAAIFMAGAVTRASRRFGSKSLGEKAGAKGVIKGLVVSNVLPPCAMLSAPIIRGFEKGGAYHPVIMAMLIGFTISAASRFFVGLAVFGPEIVGLRILFAFSAAMIVSYLYYFSYTSIFSTRGCKQIVQPVTTE